MSDIQDFIKLIHQSDDKERSMAYEQASDILKALKKEGIKEYDAEELIHFLYLQNMPDRYKDY